MIRSDWHIHSEQSYDAILPLETLVRGARELGLRRFGVTNHVNYNDESFIGNLLDTVRAVGEIQADCPELVLGVELTPVAKPAFDYLSKVPLLEGYTLPEQDEPYELELALTKEYLVSLGVRYAIGAAHWRLDLVDPNSAPDDVDGAIREWHRQQLYLASDPRVTVFGHPWWHGKGLWYNDFSRIPRSMNDELIAALKESGKYVECNGKMFFSKLATDRFRHQYAEFMREIFEAGIPMTYGSDCHGKPGGVYHDRRPSALPYLTEVGFREGDFREIAEGDLW